MGWKPGMPCDAACVREIWEARSLGRSVALDVLALTPQDRARWQEIERAVSERPWMADQLGDRR